MCMLATVKRRHDDKQVQYKSMRCDAMQCDESERQWNERARGARATSRGREIRKKDTEGDRWLTGTGHGGIQWTNMQQVPKTPNESTTTNKMNELINERT